MEYLTIRQASELWGISQRCVAGRLMLYEDTLSTQREDFYNIIAQVREAIAQSGTVEGFDESKA